MNPVTPWFLPVTRILVLHFTLEWSWSKSNDRFLRKASMCIAKWPEIVKQIHTSGWTDPNPRLTAVIKHRQCLFHWENIHWHNNVRYTRNSSVSNVFWIPVKCKFVVYLHPVLQFAPRNPLIFLVCFKVDVLFLISKTFEENILIGFGLNLFDSNVHN